MMPNDHGVSEIVVVVFAPGPVGLQLEPDVTWGSRVVRFVDGGPWDPGPARASCKIQPGDWITRVALYNDDEENDSYGEVHGNATASTPATVQTYSEIMALLQQVQSTRILTVRSFARAVLEASLNTTTSTTTSTCAETFIRQESVVPNEVVPILALALDEDTGTSTTPTFQPSIEQGSILLPQMDDDFDTEPEIKENKKGLIKQGSQPTVDPSLSTGSDNITHYHPTNNNENNNNSPRISSHPTTCSTTLHWHPWNLSRLEKQPYHGISLSTRTHRRRLVSITLPPTGCFGTTTLAENYSLIMDPKMHVMLKQYHSQQSSTCHDPMAQSTWTIPTTTSTISDAMGNHHHHHHTIHERISSLSASPPLTCFLGMIYLSSIRPMSTSRKDSSHLPVMGTTLGSPDHFHRQPSWQVDQLVWKFQLNDNPLPSQPCPPLSDSLVPTIPLSPHLIHTVELFLHDTSLSFPGRIQLQQRIGMRVTNNNNNKQQPHSSTRPFSLSSLDHSASTPTMTTTTTTPIGSWEEKQAWLQLYTQPPSNPLPTLHHNPIWNASRHEMETSCHESSACPGTLPATVEPLEIEPTTIPPEEMDHLDGCKPFATSPTMTSRKEDESSHVKNVSSEPLAPSLTTKTSAEPTDKIESLSNETNTNTLSRQSPITTQEAPVVEKETPSSMAQPAAAITTPTSTTSSPSNNNLLLRKAKAKHQLSLARLRVKKSLQQPKVAIPIQDNDNQGNVNDNNPIPDKDSTHHSTKNKMELEITSPSISMRVVTDPDTPQFCGDKGMDTSQTKSWEVGQDEPSTPYSSTRLPFSSPSVPPPFTPTIDFARFSQEQTLWFEPGPIGLQLDHCTDSLEGDYPAKVVRFVDGGPQDPGPARRSGKIQPGDFVIRVEAEGVVGTTYYTILHLLQKSWTTRKLVFRSAWEPLQMGGGSSSTTGSTPTTRTPTGTTTTPQTPVRHMTSLVRPTPRKEGTPLPYQWNPLPYDWIHKKRPPIPHTPEEQQALDQAYQEEASRIIQEKEQEKRRREAQQALQNQSSSSSSLWNFEDLVLGAVALTAESVSGCLRKQPLPDSDDDSDNDYEEEEDNHPKKD